MVEEVECAYYGIPDYILDGIHPEEDAILQEDTVKEDQSIVMLKMMWMIEMEQK
jgi:hypothetical protein